MEIYNLEICFKNKVNGVNLRIKLWKVQNCAKFGIQQRNLTEITNFSIRITLSAKSLDKEENLVYAAGEELELYIF